MGSGLLQSVRFALVLGLLVVGGLLLFELIGVVEVLVLALLIALVLAPAVDFLVGVGLPRFLALLVVVMGVVVAFGLLGYIVMPLLLDQGGEFVARAPGVARRVQEYAHGMSESYPALGGGRRRDEPRPHGGSPASYPAGGRAVEDHDSGGGAPITGGGRHRHGAIYGLKPPPARERGTGAISVE